MVGGANGLGDLVEEDADVSPSVGEAVEEGGFYRFVLGTLGCIVQIAHWVRFAIVDRGRDDSFMNAQGSNTRSDPP